MKKIIILLIILMLCLPIVANATASPTLKTKISCDPAIQFTILEELPDDLDIEGYVPVEVLSIIIDKEYGLIRWTLLTKFAVDANVKVISRADDGELTLLPVMTTVEGDLLVDFYDVKPGNYILYFLISKE